MIGWAMAGFFIPFVFLIHFGLLWSGLKSVESKKMLPVWVSFSALSAILVLFILVNSLKALSIFAILTLGAPQLVFLALRKPIFKIFNTNFARYFFIYVFVGLLSIFGMLLYLILGFVSGATPD